MSLPDYCPFAPDLPECQAPEPEPETDDEVVEPEPVDDTTGGDDGTDDVVDEPEPVDEGDEKEETEDAGEKTEKDHDGMDHDGHMHEEKEMDGWGISTDDWGKDPLLDVMKLETIMRWSMMSPMMGQITYLMVPLMGAVNVAMFLFRYSSQSTYFDAYKVNDTNWYELASMIGGYGMLAVFSITAITQLLSIFGIAVAVNGLVWMWLFGVGGMLLTATVDILLFLGYNAAYGNTSDATKAATAVTQMGLYETLMLEHTIADVAMGFALFEQFDNWVAAQFAAYPEEDQKEWVDSVIMEVEAAEKEAMEEEGMMMEKEEEAMEEEPAMEEDADVKPADVEEADEEPAAEEDVEEN